MITFFYRFYTSILLLEVFVFRSVMGTWHPINSNCWGRIHSSHSVFGDLNWSCPDCAQVKRRGILCLWIHLGKWAKVLCHKASGFLDLWLAAVANAPPPSAASTWEADPLFPAMLLRWQATEPDWSIVSTCKALIPLSWYCSNIKNSYPQNFLHESEGYFYLFFTGGS